MSRLIESLERALAPSKPEGRADIALREAMLSQPSERTDAATPPPVVPPGGTNEVIQSRGAQTPRRKIWAPVGAAAALVIIIGTTTYQYYQHRPSANDNPIMTSGPTPVSPPPNGEAKGEKTNEQGLAARPTPPVAGPGKPGQPEQQPESSSGRSATAHSGAIAAITESDGSTIAVTANSVIWAASITPREFSLNSGQSISFDRIRSIDILNVEDMTTRVQVTLVDGERTAS